jgi:Uma2 family endonuclease
MVAVSADAVGRHMPMVATLDDVTAMMAADPYGHSYELSPEGVPSVMPPPDFGHAYIANRLMAWLIKAGWPLDQLAQGVGLRVPGADGGVGGRIPDLIVWRTPQTHGSWLPVVDVLLVVEILSPGPEAADTLTKRREYAGAGIAQYWTVGRDASETVTMYRLASDGYEILATSPLAWVLNSSPSDYLD